MFLFGTTQILSILSIPNSPHPFSLFNSFYTLCSYIKKRTLSVMTRVDTGVASSPPATAVEVIHFLGPEQSLPIASASKVGAGLRGGSHR